MITYDHCPMSNLEFLLKNKYEGCEFFKIEAYGEEAKLEFDYSYKDNNNFVSGILRDNSEKNFNKSEIGYLVDFLGNPLSIEFIYSCPGMYVKITPFNGDTLYPGKSSKEKEVNDLTSFNQILELDIIHPGNRNSIKDVAEKLNSKVSYIDKINNESFLQVYEMEFSKGFIKNLYKTSTQYAKENQDLLLIKGISENRQIEIFYKKEKNTLENKITKYLGFQGKASIYEIEMLLKENKRIDYEDIEVIDAF